MKTCLCVVIALILGGKVDKAYCMYIDYPFLNRVEDIAVPVEIGISPDGSYIALAYTSHVLLYLTDSQRAMRILNYDSSEARLTWSSDSPNLYVISTIFSAYDSTQQTQIINFDLVNRVTTSQEVLIRQIERSAIYPYVAIQKLGVDGGASTAISKINLSDNLATYRPLPLSGYDEFFWSADGSRLGYIDESNQQIYIMNTIGEQVAVLEDDILTEFYGYFTSAAFSNDSTHIVVTGSNTAIAVGIDQTTPFLEATTRPLDSNLFDAAWSADGTGIWLATRGGLVLWNVGSEGKHEYFDYRAITPPVYQLAATSSGEYVYLSDFDGGAYRWDVQQACITQVLHMPYLP